MPPETDRDLTGVDFASLRRAAVLSQEELAEKANIGLSTIYLVETGKIDAPRPKTIRSLAAALGLTPQQVQAAIAESRRRAVEVSHGA